MHAAINKQEKKQMKIIFAKPRNPAKFKTLKRKNKKKETKTKYSKVRSAIKIMMAHVRSNETKLKSSQRKKKEEEREET